MNVQLKRNGLNRKNLKILNQTIISRGDNEAVTLRTAIGKYTCSIYALESMLYLTTGIMDKYDNTNIDLETAIFKVKIKHNRRISTYFYCFSYIAFLPFHSLSFIIFFFF